MEETMVERVAKAIDAVQIFSRFNDWTTDRVDGFPIEICRHGNEDVGDAIIILKRFPASKGQDAALREVVSEMRARAAIEAMRGPSPRMIAATLPLRVMPLDRETILLTEKALSLLEPEDFPEKAHAEGAHSAQQLITDWRGMIDAALSSSTRGE